MEKIMLDDANYYTTCYKDDKKRHMVVIAPGGGYDHTSLLEAFNVASKFNENGFHASVLNYRETLDSYPYPQKLLAKTISELRRDSRNDKIISIGFSAGGHLALSNALFYNEYGFCSKPNYLILCYPVISSNYHIWHQGSFKALLGDNYNEENLEKMSLERHITSDLCPIFIWHSITDESVSVLNSIELLQALKAKKVKAECHIFQEGVHGMSLSDETTGIKDKRKENPYVARWFSMMLEWLNHNLNE